MKIKAVSGCFLVMTICFIILGVIYGRISNDYTGIKTYSAAEIDGKVIITNSGVIGRDQERVSYFKDNSKIFFVLAGVCGVSTVVTFLIAKKK